LGSMQCMVSHGFYTLYGFLRIRNCISPDVTVNLKIRTFLVLMSSGHTPHQYTSEEWPNLYLSVHVNCTTASKWIFTPHSQFISEKNRFRLISLIYFAW
jgi:hypothetical protein